MAISAKWGTGSKTVGGYTTDPLTKKKKYYGTTYTGEPSSTLDPTEPTPVVKAPAPEVTEQRKRAGQQHVRDKERIKKDLVRQGYSAIGAEREASRQLTLAAPGGGGELGPQITTEQVREKQKAFAGELGAAGVFEQQGIQPIIPPEMENAGVMKDIILSLVPKGVQDTYTYIDTLGGNLDLSQPPRTEEEARLQVGVMVGGLQQTTSTRMDEQMEEIQVNEMGFGAVGGILGGILLTSAFKNPISQMIGTDRMVSNLEQGLTHYNEMITLPEGAIRAGAMTPTEAFDKVDYWESQISILESELKQAAITSPDVRISLKGRSIAGRILKIRERIQDQKRMIAAEMIGRELGTEDPAVISAFLVKMENKFKEMKNEQVA